MKKVIWKDKMLADLQKMIDVQGFVEEYLNGLVTSILYSANAVVSPQDLEVTPDVVVGRVFVPGLGFVQNGAVVETDAEYIDMFNTPYPPSGTIAPVPVGKTRVDVIVVRREEVTDEQKPVWYIDPDTDTKFTVNEDTVTKDSYVFGVVRGTAVTPPAIPQEPLPATYNTDWVKVAAIVVDDSGIIQAQNINTVDVAGDLNSLFNPQYGHKHLGQQQGDAPRLIHGDRSGTLPDQSIDPATISEDAHHPKVHKIYEPNAALNQHLGALDKSQHGRYDGPPVMHDFKALPGGTNANSINNIQHGHIDDETAHNPVSDIVDGFMTKGLYSRLIGLESRSTVIIGGVTYNGRSISYQSGNYSGGAGAPAGSFPVVEIEPKYILPDGFDGEPLIIVVPHTMVGSFGSGALTAEHNHPFTYRGETTETECSFTATNLVMGSNFIGIWVQWLAIGIPKNGIVIPNP